MTTSNICKIKEPVGFHILKIAHIPAIIIGGLLYFGILIHSFGSFGNGENLLSFLKLLAGLLGIIILALQCYSLFLIFSKRSSFRKWTNVYAIGSLISKILIFIIGLIFIMVFSSMAGHEFAKQDYFTQMLAADAYDQEIKKIAAQFFGALVLFVVISSIYPSIVLFLVNRKSMRLHASSMEEHAD